ncbi:hypothetical protein [Pontibacter arcticus]|uniref:Uncharacterized protein n=1 Tax=Pontibacter arcticus TaxID=2080288 RepID=A0A364RJ79_9BACT|nr:hypothetical protein [Pontibacter arcticus]RAU84333.1 hypothetical protein DP923_04650 [Pontibacter arcticus]
MALQLEPVHSTEFLKIEADHVARLVRTEWLRGASTEELIEGTQLLKNILAGNKYEKVLGNAQLLTSLSAESKEWLSTHFYAALSDTNLQQLARVMPENLFNKLALESVITRAESIGRISYSIKNFAKEVDALAWLNIKG